MDIPQAVSVASGLVNKGPNEDDEQHNDFLQEQINSHGEPLLEEQSCEVEQVVARRDKTGAALADWKGQLNIVPFVDLCWIGKTQGFPITSTKIEF